MAIILAKCHSAQECWRHSGRLGGLRTECCLLFVQDGPGKYNEEAWEALDRVLDEARRSGLKVMLSFLDNWKYAGQRMHTSCPPRSAVV
jgi:endo-1,4-beta-mannosidase